MGEEVNRRFEAIEQGPKETAAGAIRDTLTPYLVARDAAGLIDFVKNVFDAQEQSPRHRIGRRNPLRGSKPRRLQADDWRQAVRGPLSGDGRADMAFHV